MGAVAFILGWTLGIREQPSWQAIENSLPPNVDDKRASTQVIALGPETSSLWEPLTKILKANPAEMPGLFEACEDYPLAFRALVREWVLMRWLELDAAGAATYLQGKPRFRQATTAFIKAWVTRDPGGAMAYVEDAAASNRSDRNHLQTAVEALATTDPDRFFAYMQAHPNAGVFVGRWEDAFRSKFHTDWPAAQKVLETFMGQQRETATAALAYVWAQTDPQAAMEWSQSVSAGHRDAVRMVFRAWGEQDPTAAFRYAEANGLDPGRFLSSSIADRDPDAAFAWVSENRPENASEYLLVVRAAAAKGTAHALTLLKRVPQALRAKVAEGFIGHRLRYGGDPQPYLDWLDRQGDETLSSEVTHMFEYALNSAGSSRLEGALSAIELGEGAMSERLREMSEAHEAAVNGEFRIYADWVDGTGSPQRNLTNDYLAHWVGQDPAKAAELALAMSGHADDTRYMRTALAAWMKEDPATAAAWVQNEVGTELREPALEEAGRQWADYLPEEALNWALTLEDDERAAVVGAVSGRWAERDPELAVEWASNLNEPSIADEAVDSIASTWSQTDPEGTANWLEGLAPGELRDAAVAAFVGQHAANDLQSAIDWIASIHDAGIRTRALKELTPDYRWSDQTAATLRAIQQSSLAEEEKAAFLAHLEDSVR